VLTALPRRTIEAQQSHKRHETSADRDSNDCEVSHWTRE
jgi:hypothetical protein